MVEELETKQESSLAAVAFERTGIQLHTFDEVWRFASLAVNSNFAPKGMTIEDAVCAIQLGSEVGLSPMSALQRIAVINGRPSVWGDALLGICQRSGRFDHGAFYESFDGTPYEDNYTAICCVKRLGSAAGVESLYSVADAKRAKLWEKSGTWQTNPKRMLKYRARAFALRDAFADVVTGLYDREEMLDADIIEPRTVSSRVITDAEIEAGLRKKPPAPPPAPPNETMTKGAPPPQPIVGGQGMPTPPGYAPPAQSAPAASGGPDRSPPPEKPTEAAPASPAATGGPIGRTSDLYGAIGKAYNALGTIRQGQIREQLGIKTLVTVGTWDQAAANGALDAIEAKLAETAT